MKKSSLKKPERRDFLTKVMPGCAAACLGASQMFAGTPAIAKSLLQQGKHKFDKELPGLKPGMKLSWRDYMGIANRKYIRLARFLEKELGKDRMIELLKKDTEERQLRQAKRDLKQLGNSDFKSYISIFRRPDMLATLTMEIIEDTEKVFEIKVTECLTADCFLRAKAGDIGYAAVCWGDYSWATNFNSKIKLIRDKTLCEGHDFCNHRYVWTG